MRLAKPAVRAALRGKATVREATVRGKQVISAFEPVPATGWVVRTDIRTGDAFADIGRIRLLVIALALLFTIALIALALTLSRNAERSSQARLNERLQAQRCRASAYHGLGRRRQQPLPAGRGRHADRRRLPRRGRARRRADRRRRRRRRGHWPGRGRARRGAARGLARADSRRDGSFHRDGRARPRSADASEDQPDAFASAVLATVSADRRTVSICLAGASPADLRRRRARSRSSRALCAARCSE